ncbi:NAD(P)-binding Rossmann-like domain protein [Mycobacterium intracellulare 1956]|uniref:NAD(P)-binding Rossmann-like domain protein n=1 Tax=Mycobacterium intracellulare 1956 TaxID=1299331 RepID=X8CLJ4_MYCIT|nr:NAD(P)-binding Rossmann-like domain protein [Mycobacterium intracellulare 1956]
MPDSKADARDHALVIGGSIAGLCAARVLSDAYSRVTVYERDELPAFRRTGRRSPRTGTCTC